MLVKNDSLVIAGAALAGWWFYSLAKSKKFMRYKNVHLVWSLAPVYFDGANIYRVVIFYCFIHDEWDLRFHEW